jgi:phosphoribosylformylglycinamidine synthase
MLWELEIRPLGLDRERERVCDEFDLLTHAQRGGDLVTASARGFLLEGELTDEHRARLIHEVLVDPLVEVGEFRPVGERAEHAYTVLLKPGVMEPVAQTVLDTVRMLGIPVTAVRTFRRYFGPPELPSLDRDVLFRKVLANDAIEQIVVGPVKADHLALGKPYEFKRVTVPLRDLDDAGLVKLSKDNTLALSLDENEGGAVALPRTRPRADRRGTGNRRADVVRALLAQDAPGHDYPHRSLDRRNPTYQNLLKRRCSGPRRPFALSLVPTTGA